MNSYSKILEILDSMLGILSNIINNNYVIFQI